MKRSAKEREKFIQPLQRYDVSQLKLVGIIWDINNPRALVEDASGKGFIVTKGVLIGRNEGRVTEIRDNEVTVMEETVDFYGDRKVNEIKLKLYKGEEERKFK